MLASLGRVTALLLVVLITGCNSGAPVLKSGAVACAESDEVSGDFPIHGAVNHYVVNQIIGAKSGLPGQLADALEDHLNVSFAAKSLHKKKLHEIEEVIEGLRPIFPYDAAGALPDDWAWGESVWIAKVFESGEVEVVRMSFTEDGIVVVQTSSLVRADSSASQLSSEEANGQAARTILSEAYYEDAGGVLLRKLEALAPRQSP